MAAAAAGARARPSLVLPGPDPGPGPSPAPPEGAAPPAERRPGHDRLQIGHRAASPGGLEGERRGSGGAGPPAGAAASGSGECGAGRAGWLAAGTRGPGGGWRPRAAQRPSEAARSLVGRTVCVRLSAWQSVVELRAGFTLPAVAVSGRASVGLPEQGLSLLLYLTRPRPRVFKTGASGHLWALRLGCFQEPAGRAAAPATDLTLDGNPVPITSGGSFWWERGAEAVR